MRTTPLPDGHANQAYSAKVARQRLYLNECNAWLEEHSYLLLGAEPPFTNAKYAKN